MPRHSFVPAAQQHIRSSDNSKRSVLLWTDHRWKAEWLDNPTSPRNRHSTSWNCWVWLNASAPVLDASAPAFTDGVWSLLRPVSVAQTNNRRPCCLLMSNPSSSSWTARPDSSCWRDNRTAAQRLPQDLVRPTTVDNNNHLKRRRSIFAERHCWT